MNNKKLLELRSRSVKEQNKLRDAGGKKERDQSETETVRQLRSACIAIGLRIVHSICF